MKLIQTCPTCNNNCAKNAQTCIKCGYVFQPAWYSIGNDMQSVAKIVMIIICIIFLLAMISPLFISSGSGPESVEDAQKRWEKYLNYEKTRKKDKFPDYHLGTK